MGMLSTGETMMSETRCGSMPSSLQPLADGGQRPDYPFLLRAQHLQVAMDHGPADLGVVQTGAVLQHLLQGVRVRGVPDVVQ